MRSVPVRSLLSLVALVALALFVPFAAAPVAADPGIVRGAPIRPGAQSARAPGKVDGVLRGSDAAAVRSTIATVTSHEQPPGPERYPTIPLDFERLPASESRRRVLAFRDHLRRRRTVRDFSTEPVPDDVVDAAIEAAGTAPSGANRQPWRFVVVRDPGVRRRLREAAEKEERDFYERRATPEWRADLAPLGTDWRKPFLETAPVLIAVFRVDYDPEPGPDGVERHHKNYYVAESVGIAVGLLLLALHTAGLATLTHTPSPMGFLRELLSRPLHERAYLLVPAGYPAEGARVPDIRRKPLDAIRVVV